MCTQVGCVLGKQGSIVSRVRESTGAMVRVLEQNKGQRRLETGEEVDEVIEIQGRAQSCDSALQAVSDLLRQYQVGTDDNMFCTWGCLLPCSMLSAQSSL